MPFNGSGSFVREHSWTADRANGIKVRADRSDEEDNGFAAGLSLCITRDGQSSIAADIPFNNKKITGLGDATGATHAMNRQSSDARFIRNPNALGEAETSVADADIWAFWDTSAGANKPITHQSFKTTIAQAARLPGEIADYAGSTAPALWLMCYGQAVSRSTYAALFTAIGTAFGVGDGTSTFNLPDCRGRVVAGQDDMGGTSANRLTGLTNGVNGDNLAAAGGLESATLLQANLPSGVNLSSANLSASTSLNANGTVAQRVPGTFPVGGAANTRLLDGDPAAVSFSPSTTISGTVPLGGSGTPVNIVQPTIILNKIIFAGV